MYAQPKGWVTALRGEAPLKNHGAHETCAHDP